MRDYRKESLLRKEKKKRFVVDIDKGTANKLCIKLKEDNLEYSTWIKENIKKYIV